MTGTLSIVELIWIMVALVATYYSARGLIRWRREDRQRKTDGLNGPLAVFYRGKIRLYSFGMLAFFLCLVLGIEVALVPAPPMRPMPGLQTVAAKAAFLDGPFIIIGVVALFALALILDDRDRTLTDRAHDKKAEQRLLSIEAAARHAAVRADVAERRADTAAVAVEGLTPRVDTAEGELGVHTGEITDHTDRLDALEHPEEGKR